MSRKHRINLYSDTRTHFDDNVLKDVVTTLKELTTIVEATLSKKDTLISGCRNKSFKYNQFRKILYLLNDIHEKEETLQENKSTYDKNKWISSIEQFYMDIYNVSTINDTFINSIPTDAYETLCYLYTHPKDFYISEREGKALYYRYIKAKDLNEIGILIDNVSAERTRMIIVEAIQKLKSQKVNRLLHYGIGKYHIIQEEISIRTQEEINAHIKDIVIQNIDTNEQLNELKRNLHLIPEKLQSLVDVTITQFYQEDSLLCMPIEKLGLSVRSLNCLTRAHIKTLGELSKLTHKDLLNIRNIGKKS